MNRSLAPVVVFAYNRPVHLQRTLDALAGCRLAGQTEVYAFADGPRNDAAVAKVAEVRAVLTREAEQARFAGFHVDAAIANRGLANSIIRGVGSVIERHGRAIVLEDDLLVAPDFLEFMNDCLEYYAEDLAVGSIAGSCPLDRVPAEYPHSVFAMTRNSSHGWATWARVWSRVDWSGSGYSKLQSSLFSRLAFNREGNDRFDRLQRQLAGKIDSWSIRFGLFQFLENLVTVYPVINRVTNIGFDGSGIHCKTDERRPSQATESAYTLKQVFVHPALRRAFRHQYSGRQPGRLMRDIIAFFPRLTRWFGR